MSLSAAAHDVDRVPVAYSRLQTKDRRVEYYYSPFEKKQPRKKIVAKRVQYPWVIQIFTS